MLGTKIKKRGASLPWPGTREFYVRRAEVLKRKRLRRALDLEVGKRFIDHPKCPKGAGQKRKPGFALRMYAISDKIEGAGAEPKTKFAKKISPARNKLARGLRVITMASVYAEEPKIVMKGHMALLNAIEDAAASLKIAPEALKVASIGSGELTHEMWLKKRYPGMKIEARDKYLAMVFSGKRELLKAGLRGEIPYRQGDFKNPNLSKGGFDFVFSLDALHWPASYKDKGGLQKATEETRLAIGNMAALLGGRGSRLLITYRPTYRDGKLDVLPPQEIEKVLRSAGLEPIVNRTIGFKRITLKSGKKVSRKSYHVFVAKKA